MMNSIIVSAHPHRRRWLWGLLAATLTVLIAYVTSYCVVRHRGLQEATAEGRPAFFYVSRDQYYHSATGRATHFRLLFIYAPLNWIDTTFLGGLPASRGGVEKLTGCKQAGPHNA